MTLQEALISLGDRPLNSSPYSAAIRAIVLASLGKKGSTIDKDTPGYIVLSQVYKIVNEAKRTALLEHNLGVVRGTDLYKQVMLFGAATLTLVVIVLAMAVVYGDTTISPEMWDIFKFTLTQFFDLLKFVAQLWSDAQQATPAPAA
jgi:hypothetical protein